MSKNNGNDDVLLIKNIKLFTALSLSSHTEHTTYIVGYLCKPYIQSNQSRPDPSYTRVIRVYLWKPCMAFKTFKTWYECHIRVWSYNWSKKTARERVRSYETVWDRIYNRTWSPLHECAYTFSNDRHTTNTV